MVSGGIAQVFEWMIVEILRLSALRSAGDESSPLCWLVGPFILTCSPLLLNFGNNTIPNWHPHTSMRMRLLPDFCTIEDKKRAFVVFTGDR